MLISLATLLGERKQAGSGQKTPEEHADSVGWTARMCSVVRSHCRQLATADERHLGPSLPIIQRSPHPRRVLVLGATGTIGRATTRALVQSGHGVVCFVRSRARGCCTLSADESARLLPGAALRFGDVTDPASLARDGFSGERFDAVVSCLASRTGAPRDAWAVDYEAHVNALAAAKSAGVTHMVLLSAICVQKPLLAFQHAKLAFERALIESGLTYSIVRPIAFFKSLSGQVDRLKRGKSSWCLATAR